MAGNQLGKTWAGAFETAMHLTGLYPDWWEGKRFDKPVTGWFGSKTGEVTRDAGQKLLLGEPKDRAQWGTGTIPKSCIVGDPSLKRGLADAVDTISVKHVSGGTSFLTFKTYDQGRQKWQAATLDFVWLDEECDYEIYTEAVTRTNATGGIVYMTFTPLLGMSETVHSFMSGEFPDKSVTTMTIDDAEHYTQEERDRIIASYPAHEREARVNGVPMLGSGKIFPVEESLIKVEPIMIPQHWPQIIGIDFGWDHPTTAVNLAWDRDNDTVYVTACYTRSEAVPAIHSAAIKSWGAWKPVAWPQDALQHSKGSGQTLREDYQRHGLNMLREHAKFEDGGNGVEAGLFIMLERMETSSLKVFSTCTEWFEEFRMYHRKNGKVVKERDDIMDATRYGIMCLRYAEVERRNRTTNTMRRNIA